MRGVERSHGPEGTEAPVVVSLDRDARLALGSLLVGLHEGGGGLASLADGGRRPLDCCLEWAERVQTWLPLIRVKPSN